MKQLMERNTAGLFVELIWQGEKNIILKVQDGDEVYAATIPPSKAIDAFIHPFYYLSDREKNTDNSQIVSNISPYTHNE